MLPGVNVSLDLFNPFSQCGDIFAEELVESVGSTSMHTMG
jgi:hypothetical protein